MAFGFALAAGIIAPLAAPLFGYSGPLRWLIAIAAIDLMIMPPFKMPGIIFQVDMQQWYAVGLGLAPDAVAHRRRAAGVRPRRVL